MASPRVTGSSRTFTKFLVPPSSTSRLGATLRPIEQAVPSPPPHRKVKSWDPPEPTPASSRSLFTVIGLLFACLAVTIFLLSYDSSLAAIHPTASLLVNLPPVAWHTPIEPLASDVFLDDTFLSSSSVPPPTSSESLRPPLPTPFADDLPPAFSNETQTEPYEPKAGLAVLFHLSDWDWDAPIRLGLRGREIVETVWRWMGDVVRGRRSARA